jgi:EmrB/QacA subfamily drug resistance transporter
VSPATLQPSFLGTRRGKLTLAFLCGVAFLDFVDASIVNVALPSIRHSLHFSVQSLQWVLSGYLLTYGGFMLLGGRASDLIGRRRVLVAGTAVFAASSLTAGLAGSEGMLIGARLVQGVGAAMMIPAALSILTTSFAEGHDRAQALAAWGATAGLASALGVFLGGVLSGGPGWRWVFFVNLPVCVLDLVAVFRLIDSDRRAVSSRNFDLLGAVFVTTGMLVLIYTLVKAPQIGWGDARTIAGLGAAAALLAAFAVNERRHPDPLFPFSILRINGLAAADLTQVVAVAGSYSMFFFVTLYMQDVLGFSRIDAGLAYVPTALGVAVAAGICSRLLPRVGTRPLIVGGALIAAAGIYPVSRIPVHGS